LSGLGVGALSRARSRTVASHIGAGIGGQASGNWPLTYPN